MQKRKFKVFYNYQLKTQNEVQELWTPAPLTSDYQTVSDLQWQTNSILFEQAADPVFHAKYFFAKWPSTVETAELQLQFDVEIVERIGGNLQPLTAEERALYLQARPHVPTDGIVQETAQKITNGITDPYQQAKAIFNWLCEHAERDRDQIGCGLGNVKDSLINEHICGRCVDISSVFVALMRAANIPAREIFGVRLGPSKHAEKLGKTGVISESQHCRCEFYIDGLGWVPCDPGDVTKVALDENLQMSDPRYLEIREKLFGYWEPNWLAYNSGRDFQLSPSTGSLENYLMYPIAINLGERSNPYLPQEFTYQITSEETNSGN